MSQPNKITLAALFEAEKIARDPTVKEYTNLNELFVDLEKDNDDDLHSDIDMVKKAGNEHE